MANKKRVMRKLLTVTARKIRRKKALHPVEHQNAMCDDTTIRNSDAPAAPGVFSPNNKEPHVLVDRSNHSPAVLVCQKPSKTFSQSAGGLKKERKRVASCLFTPQRELDGAVQSPKRPRLEQIDFQESECDEGLEGVELIVESAGPADRLDMIQRRHVVSLPHVLRQYETILNHPRTCTGGRMKLQKEINVGLFTTLRFACDMCAQVSTLTTDPAGTNLNTALAWGGLSIGAGYSQVQELMALLDLASPGEKLYRKCEHAVGEAWKTEFEKARVTAVEAEKKHAISQGAFFDGMPAIAVKVDGGWCKRTYGHGYNAKSGVACVIGAHTNQLLYVGVENKFCRVCNNAARREQDVPEHECNATYKGPSTAMESKIVVKGLTSLQEKDGLFAKFIIGDGDSNTFNAIKQYNVKGRHCVKLECANHATRCYTSKLHAIAKDSKVDINGRNLLTPLIPRLTSAARGAIRNNAGKTPAELRRDLLNGPRHVFGDHSECDESYCRRKEDNEPNYLERATLTGVLEKVQNAVLSLCDMANRLCMNQTTNTCESYMSKVSKFSGGKRVDFSTGRSYGIRCLGAALLYTYGPSFHLRAWQGLFSSPLGVVAETVFTHREVKRERKVRVRQKQKEDREAGIWVPRRTAASGADKNYGATYEQILRDNPDVSPEELQRRMDAILKRLQDRVRTDEDVQRIEEATRGQGDNPFWHEVRADVLPASTHPDVVTKKDTTPRGNLVKALYLKRPLDSIDHIKEGHIAEKAAKKAYEQRFGVQAVDCGSFIRRDKPYLLASHDFLVGQKGSGEVKHFSKIKNETILETFRNPKLRKKLRGALRYQVLRVESAVGKDEGKGKGKNSKAKTSINNKFTGTKNETVKAKNSKVTVNVNNSKCKTNNAITKTTVKANKNDKSTNAKSRKCTTNAKNSEASANKAQKRSDASEEQKIIVPNEKSKVYCQVQSQMAISGRDWCDLIFHSDNDWEVFRIERDDAFWEKSEKKLTSFYFDSLLPELADSRLQRGLPPREPQYVIDALRAAGKPLPFDVEDDGEDVDDGEVEDDVDEN